MALRIRRSQFSGQEDKWLAPHDDIRNCMPAIIRAGLEMAYAWRPELKDGMCTCAAALAQFGKGALLAKKPVPDLIRELQGKFEEAGMPATAACLDGIARSALAYYATALRETSAHADLTSSEVQDIAKIGALLSRLPAERQAQVIEWLKESGGYPEALDRPAPPGKLVDPETGKEDDEGKAGEGMQPA